MFYKIHSNRNHALYEILPGRHVTLRLSNHSLLRLSVVRLKILPVKFFCKSITSICLLTCNSLDESSFVSASEAAFFELQINHVFLFGLFVALFPNISPYHYYFLMSVHASFNFVGFCPLNIFRFPYVADTCDLITTIILIMKLLQL